MTNSTPTPEPRLRKGDVVRAPRSGRLYRITREPFDFHVIAEGVDEGREVRFRGREVANLVVVERDGKPVEEVSE